MSTENVAPRQYRTVAPKQNQGLRWVGGGSDGAESLVAPSTLSECRTLPKAENSSIRPVGIVAPNFRPVGLSVNRRRGFVYFATDGVLIKIGHSVGPTGRVCQLRSPTKAGPVRLIDFFPGYMDEEHNVHRIFPDLLAHKAEWFRRDSRILDFIALLDAHRAPLSARRISINDVIFGRHIKILEMPVMEQPKPNIPNNAAEFERWANNHCRVWDGPMQEKAYYAIEALKGLKHAKSDAIAVFTEAYHQWSGLRRDAH